jgi:hypothetical protein
MASSGMLALVSHRLQLASSQPNHRGGTALWSETAARARHSLPCGSTRLRSLLGLPHGRPSARLGESRAVSAYLRQALSEAIAASDEAACDQAINIILSRAAGPWKRRHLTIRYAWLGQSATYIVDRTATSMTL